MGGQASYDRFGSRYDIGSIFNQTTRSFNLDAYNAYSALYIPGPLAMVYLLAFALTTSLLTHTILYHGKSLLDGIRRTNVEEDDIHAKLMKHYPEVPDRWYTTLGIAFFILGVVAIEVYPTGTPVYALALSILLPALYMLPCGFIYAVTSQGVAINLMAELIPAGLLPGQPLPNMVCWIVSLKCIILFTDGPSRYSRQCRFKPLDPPSRSCKILSWVII
jgi:OPT oligopeptide transporter protein